MKKHAILILLAALTPLVGTAQSITLRPHVGLNASWFANEEFWEEADNKLDAKPLVGWTIGAEIDYRSGGLLGATVALDYCSEGTRYADGNYITGMRYRQHRIVLPLLAQLQIGTTGVAIEAGLRPWYLASANLSYNDGDGKQSDSATGHFNRLHIDIPVGLSYTHGSLKATLRYHIGLTKQYRLIGDATARSLSLTLGYGLPL